MSILIPRLLLAVTTVLVGAAAPVARFTAPLQPWTSPDGYVALLRPAIARPTTSDAPIGALMVRGWRLDWTGTPIGPGHVVVRLLLPTRPVDPKAEGAGTEVLQVGVSHNPGFTHDCLGAAFTGTAASDRVLGGVRYSVRRNSDAGMNQRIDAVDLRAVVGRCYAVERFHYGSAPGVQDPAQDALPQAKAAALLDAALSSLRISVGNAPIPEAQSLHMPSGTVAR